MSKKLFDPSAYFKRRPRVYVLPTGAGIAFLALIMAMIFMSAVYASPTLQFLGFFLFALYTLSFAWTHSHLRKLEGLSFTMGDGFAGESAFVKLRAHSGSGDERQGLEIKVHLRAEGRKAVTLTSPAFALETVGALAETYPVPLTLTRGRWSVRRITLGTTAPFGLATAWMQAKLEEPLFVYPRRKEVTPRLRPEESVLAVSPSPGEENFRTLAESHWMTSALHVVPKPVADESTIIVKKFEGEDGGVPFIDWNELNGDFEERLSRCADGLARWEPGGALRLRTPFLDTTVRSETERRAALVRLAEARA